MSASADSPLPAEFAGLPAAREPQPGRSTWREVGAMLPDIGRLLRALVVDPRVPVHAKVLAGVAAAYVTVPVGPFPDVPGTGVGVDDFVAVVWAVRRLVAAAGYDVVRELWSGTDAGFAMLVVLAGVDA